MLAGQCLLVSQLPRLSRHLIVSAPKKSSPPASQHRLLQTLVQQDISIPEMMLPGRHQRRQKLPAVLMRAGTSKGLFIRRENLPSDMSDWTGPLLSAMGSAEGDPRQIDGIGGATSTTSKVAVVGRSSVPGIDVEYTFGQVGVGKKTVDFTGNCGNMAAGVGPFALNEGLVRARQGQGEMQVRILNTNTSRVLVATLAVDKHGRHDEEGDYAIDGVPGTGSLIRLAFLNPAGSMTGSLLPTGNAVDAIHIEETDTSVAASLIDAANPFVLIDAATMPSHLMRQGLDSPQLLQTVESIRRAGAVMMGLAASAVDAAAVQGTPKAALVAADGPSGEAPAGRLEATKGLHVTAFSMGKPHPSLQLTGAVCLGAAAAVAGSVPHRAMRAGALPTPERTPSPGACAPAGEAPKRDVQTFRIWHARGLVTVDVESGCGQDGRVDVKSATVSRTARALFEGNVLYYT